MSRICPGAGACSGATNSSPPETIPTRKRRATRTAVTPSATSPPRSWGRNSASMVAWPTSCVCSTITTASAPSGSMPPVAIRAHSPVPSARFGAWPIKTSSTTSRYAGSPSVAPNVSAARTANPSIVDRRKVGRSAGELMSSASTRSSASRVGTSSPSARAGTCCKSTSSACGGVRTLNSSRLVVTAPRSSAEELRLANRIAAELRPTDCAEKRGGHYARRVPSVFGPRFSARSSTRPPVIRTRSRVSIGKTLLGVPAAAHTCS